MSLFRDNVHFVVSQIPYGKVVSYGQVALYAGLPRAARQVGWILNLSEGKVDLPWWRVINNAGKITIKGNRYNTPDTQRKLLVSEGVLVDEDFNLDIETYRWIPNDDVHQLFQSRTRVVNKLADQLPINSALRRK